jgi:hypothetical protein
MKEGWKNFSEAFKQSWNKVFRYGCYFVLIEFVLLGIGFGVWMIFHGLWVAASRLAIYWKPARVWFYNLLKTQNEQWLQTPPMNWYRWISLIAYLFMAFAFIYFGARMIVENGFLKQNPIYLLLSQ